MNSSGATKPLAGTTPAADWVAVPPATRQTLRAVSFVDEARAVAAGYGGAVLRSESLRSM